MAWTNVAKPNTSNYTNVNPLGREQYDQASVQYDDANVFYDGVNPNQWSDVSKPGAQSWTNIAKPV